MSAGAPEAEALRDRLAELEVEHATLRSELAAFHSDYLRQVGYVDVQVQEVEARILAIVAARSGAVADQVAAEAAEQRYRETTTALSAVPAPAGPPPTDDLKSLFRDAAKRMHPDLVSDDAGREHAEAFMKRLNQAYKGGDAEGIGNLVRQWETSPYASARPALGGGRAGAARRDRTRRGAPGRGPRLRPRAADGAGLRGEHGGPRSARRAARRRRGRARPGTLRPGVVGN